MACNKCTGRASLLPYYSTFRHTSVFYLCMALMFVTIPSFTHATASPIPDASTPTDSPENVSYRQQSLLEAYVDLQDNLLNRTAVLKKVPPHISDSRTIYMYLEPTQIISVDDGKQAVMLKTVLDFYWFDPNFMWNANDYLGINSLHVASNLLWTPRIGMPQSIDNTIFNPQDIITLYDDGAVEMLTPGNLNFLYFLDMEFFPFDHHKCEFAFLVDYGYILVPMSEGYTELKQYFETGAEWTLLSYNCADSNKTVDTAHFADCSIHMRRRSTFYVINIVVPMALTSVMTLMVFLLPADSGEKISFLVSIFVSTSVFLNFIVDFLPKSLEKVPRINILLHAVLCKIIAATLASVWVMSRYKRQVMREQNKTKTEQNKDCIKTSTLVEQCGLISRKDESKERDVFATQFVHFETVQNLPQQVRNAERFESQFARSELDSKNADNHTEAISSSILHFGNQPDAGMKLTSKMKTRKDGNFFSDSFVKQCITKCGKPFRNMLSCQSEKLSYSELDKALLVCFTFISVVFYVGLLIL